MGQDLPGGPTNETWPSPPSTKELTKGSFSWKFLARGVRSMGSGFQSLFSPRHPLGSAWGGGDQSGGAVLVPRRQSGFRGCCQATLCLLEVGRAQEGTSARTPLPGKCSGQSLPPSIPPTDGGPLGSPHCSKCWGYWGKQNKVRPLWGFYWFCGRGSGGGKAAGWELTNSFPLPILFHVNDSLETQ